MTRAFPSGVDVAIVGSGPTGAAYARILSERSPDATVALFEVGPALTDPPGMHVKNIADLDERLVAQRRSEGVRPHTAHTRTHRRPVHSGVNCQFLHIPALARPLLFPGHVEVHVA